MKNSIWYFFLTLWMSSLAPIALAWGTAGHRVVAYTAERNLSQHAHDKIRSMLSIEGKKSIVEIAVWADKNRNSYPGSAYHTVRIPFGASHYDEQRDCLSKKKICIVKSLQDQIDILRDTTSSSEKKLLALKLVVHFVGDIHQPLHAIANSEAKANWRGELISMHSLWDTYLLKELRLSSSRIATAFSINGQVFSYGDPIVWANESYSIALKFLEPQIAGKAVDEPIKIDEIYFANAQKIALERIEVAGLRLANLLNSIYIE